MHLDLTPEALLAQLGYTRNEQTLEQMNNIIENTKDFDKFSQHIPSFNDALAVEKGFIAMSNSEDLLKIKCDWTSMQTIFLHLLTLSFTGQININFNYRKLMEKIPITLSDISNCR